MDSTTDFELVTTLDRLSDPRRVKSTVHSLVDVVFTAICAAIADCNTWVETAAFAAARLDWLRRFVPLENGAPSHDTFGRIFAALDTAEFAKCLFAWTEELEKATEGRVIAIDGKTLRNSFDATTGRAALHLVSAWSAKNRLVLGQVATDAKSNEITAIPRLLDMLNVEGATVTIDAMGCQKEIAKTIVEKGGNYVLALKDNQPTLHRSVMEFFESATSSDETIPGLRRFVQTERLRGADEIREHMIVPVPKDLAGTQGWKDLRSIAMVTRRRIEDDGTETGDVRHYILSLPARVRPFAYAVREHWGIENRLHWTLDVTFTEDKSRIRKDSAPATTAMLRRVAVSKLQQDTSFKGSLRVKRKAAGWSTDLLERILTGKAV